jgi:hypothetical protein
MKLLTIGGTTINFDRVNCIDDTGDSISITFDNSVEYPLGSIQIRKRGEVEALRRWLEANAEKVDELAEGSTGEPLGDPQPYISPR